MAGMRSGWALWVGAALGGLLGCPGRGPGTSSDGRNGTDLRVHGTGEGGPAGGVRGDVRSNPAGGGSATGGAGGGTGSGAD